VAEPVEIELAPILERLEIIDSAGEIPRFATGITQDSRRVKPGFVFAARSGARARGLDFIPDASRRGAWLVVTADALPEEIPIPAVRVRDFRRALVALSHAIYRDPSRRLNLIGITGTNGKTSCTYILRSIFRAAGMRAGLVGTTGYDTGGTWIPADLTTPDIDRLCELLSDAVEAGCEWMVMEVSSHALALGRTSGLSFKGAGFTNLSPEHLDFHGTVEEYGAAKSRLFRSLFQDALAVVNIDDPYGRVMAEAARCRVLTYGVVNKEADLVATILEQSLNGGRFLLQGDGEPFEVHTRLVGGFQVGNIALCAAMALEFGVSRAAVVRGVEAVDAIPGRMEPVDAGQPFTVLIDYSHTPDSLGKAIESTRDFSAGRLIVVFGCGGDRDRSKRPAMGRIAAETADLVVVTSDNPRGEDPEAIIAEIVSGVPRERKGLVETVVDRRAAIKRALEIAQESDILLISGKGHESYQETRGVRRPFDDRAVVREELAQLGWRSEANGGVR